MRGYPFKVFLKMRRMNFFFFFLRRELTSVIIFISLGAFFFLPSEFPCNSVKIGPNECFTEKKISRDAEFWFMGSVHLITP